MSEETPQDIPQEIPMNDAGFNKIIILTIVGILGLILITSL